MKKFINKSKPKDNFTIISNDLILNKDLSANAKFILISILSKPENFKISKSKYHLQIGIGRKLFIKGFNELINFGYAKSVKFKENNRYVYEHYFSDTLPR